MDDYCTARGIPFVGNAACISGKKWYDLAKAPVKANTNLEREFFPDENNEELVALIVFDLILQLSMGTMASGNVACESLDDELNSTM
jgi:hypothetical protein